MVSVSLLTVKIEYSESVMVWWLQGSFFGLDAAVFMPLFLLNEKVPIVVWMHIKSFILENLQQKWEKYNSLQYMLFKYC